MACAVIHVGMEKTGTTYLQKFLTLNAEMLAQQDIGYPRFLGQTNHTKIVIGFGAHDGKLRRRLGIITDEALVQHRTELSTSMTRAINTAHHDQWIFTSEYLSSRLRDNNSVDRFHQWMCTWFNRFQVVMYLRRQDFTAPSAYSTYVRTGGPREWGFADLTGPYFDLTAVVNRWRQAFGSANVAIRPYLESPYRQTDLIDDFLQTVSLPTDYPWRRPTADANLRLTANAVEALRLANLADQRDGRQPTGPQRRQRTQIVTARADGPNWSFPIELTREIRQHFDAANRKLVETLDDPNGSWQTWLNQEPTGHPTEQPATNPDQVAELLTLATRSSAPSTPQKRSVLRKGHQFIPWRKH
ncbi:MAG: hypothetical protein Q8P61_09280 [Candidatus Nanopelagicales bacterium]|nr:hypothetical protein [Candidatus Nanopelagicales bacterium]